MEKIDERTKLDARRKKFTQDLRTPERQHKHCKEGYHTWGLDQSIGGEITRQYCMAADCEVDPRYIDSDGNIVPPPKVCVFGRKRD